MYPQRRRTKSNSWLVSICTAHHLNVGKKLLKNDISERHKGFLVINFCFAKMMYFLAKQQKEMCRKR